MKLYATVTSERASKGQGGNKYLEIGIQVEREDGTRPEVAKIKVVPHELGYSFLMTSHNGDVLYRDQYIDNSTKGEKQKGELGKDICTGCWNPKSICICGA